MIDVDSQETHRQEAMRILRRNNPESLLRQVEVAALLRLSTKTIASYADTKKLPFIRTPGGRRMFRAADVRAIFVFEEVGVKTKEGAVD